MPTAAEEAKAAAANPNPASGQQQQQQPASALPAEYQGKSAEDIYKAVSEKYKDYDTIKTRAASAEAYEKLNLAPDKIQETMTWVQNLLNPLMSGKAAKWDKENNRILFVDEAGNVQSAPANQQQADPFQNWETLAATDQAKALEEHVWNTRVTPRINEIVKGYDNQFRNALGALEQRVGMFMDVIDRVSQNPKLKARDVLGKMMDLAKNGQNPSSFLDMAINEMNSPAEMEAKIQEGIAAGIADWKAKNASENASPILDTPFTMRPRAHLGADGKKIPSMKLFENIVTNVRQNGAH